MTSLLIIQLIVAVLLIGAIMLQSRGTGLGAAFGGEGNVYRTKRGLEKSVFRATVVLAALFLGTALAATVLNPSAFTATQVPEDLPASAAPASPSAGGTDAAAADATATPETENGNGS